LSCELTRMKADKMNARITPLDGLDVTCLAAATLSAEVRQRIGYRLASWRLEHLADDARLIAAELVANACAATPAGEIRVTFSREPAAVLLAVWDSSDAMPRVGPIVELEPEHLDLSPEGWDANGGWGLPIVRALASECGVTETPPRGKWVWARLAVPGSAG
jgi:signal transduction histidine kinase